MAAKQTPVPPGRGDETANEDAGAAEAVAIAQAGEAAHDAAEADSVSVKRRMPDNLRKYLIRVQGGRLYLPAAYRIVWFRDECPDWGVETMLIEGGQEAGFATVQARIYDSNGKVIASGIKTETQRDFPAGHVEKAETGAIGRALAVAGFGTQFAPELDESPAEGHLRVVDSPQPVGRPAYAAPARPASRVAEGQARTVRVDAGEGSEQAGSEPALLPPGAVWDGPGQCPRCHAPEGKRHLKPCVG